VGGKFPNYTNVDASSSSLDIFSSLFVVAVENPPMKSKISDWAGKIERGVWEGKKGESKYTWHFLGSFWWCSLYAKHVQTHIFTLY